MQPTDEEIVVCLMIRRTPKRHLRDAFEMVKMRMHLHWVCLSEAADYVMKWIQRVDET